MPDFNYLLTMDSKELEEEFSTREKIILGRQVENSLSEKFKDFETKTLFKAIQIITEPQVTIGENDLKPVYRRKETITLEPPSQIEKHAEAVALICPKGYVKQEGEISILTVKRVKQEYSLCSDSLKIKGEDFIHEPANQSFSTGMLFRDDQTLLTSGHCIPKGKNPKNYRVVFGYQMNSDGTWDGGNTSLYRFVVKSEDVFIPCDEIDRGRDIADWVAFRLDKPTRRQPLVASTDNLSKDTQVYVLGYPLGMPLKTADNAKVVTQAETIFTASLDIYASNSGSPVFNAETHKLEGIVIKAEDDFESNPVGENCKLLKVAFDVDKYASTCVRISSVNLP